MTRPMYPAGRRTLRQALAAWFGVIGLMGAAAAPAEADRAAGLSPDRAALEARVQAVRAALAEATADPADDAPDTGTGADPRAQPKPKPPWLNWNNWNNWNNWPNWGNWGNWLNR